MAKYEAPIGRNVGRVDTDSGGLARYSLKIQLSPGIRPASNPELSLEYYQGAPNGSLGVGWALGGISCIRQAPSNLAYDADNPLPSDYDRSSPKLTLDGAELLNVEGKYGASNAKYMTELEQNGRVISAVKSGFVLTDGTGAKAEYGTSDDSRVLDMSGQVREWWMKTSIDYHGNTTVYTYVSSPQGSNGNINTCYLSNIRYSSNAKTGFEGGRLVQFEYSTRPDTIFQNLHGAGCIWTSILTAIRCCVVQAGQTLVGRSYELRYSPSEETGDSCLASVTETASRDGQEVQLLPSIFRYSQMGISKEDIFKSPSQQLSTLPATTHNVTLFSMNISGRCLADIAVIRYISNRMSIKTYLATRGKSGTIDWVPSNGPGAEALLPAIDFKAGFPDILTPDLSKSGRADFVVPYPDTSNNLQFSISQSTGTGFQDARTKSTRFRWTAGSKFISIENTGQRSSIIQVFPDQEKLTFRNFVSFSEDGRFGLRDAISTLTKYAWKGTIDWIQIRHAGTGSNSLVRVWGDELPFGRVQIKATAFTITKDAFVKEGATSLLGDPTLVSAVKYSVLPCDINADGAQDILLATAEYRQSRMYLTVKTFLGDGYGGFKPNMSSITREVIAPTPMKSTDFGQFHVTNLNGSNYPSLSYVYRAKFSRAYACVTVDGRSDGQLSNATCLEIDLKLPGDNIQVVAADLNGNGMGDWLLWTLDGGVPKLAPVYNHANIVDFLSSAEDPMGLRTSIAYGCMSDPSVYTPGVDWKGYINSSMDSYAVIAAPNYVVTSLQHTNNPSINSSYYSVLIKKTYAKARINFLGRGWQGFEEVNTINDTDKILTTEIYHQIWPLTGSKKQIDTKTLDGQVVRSERSGYRISSEMTGPWKILRYDTILHQTDMLSAGSVARSHKTQYTYDRQGNVTMRSVAETQNGYLMHQSWRRCAYATIDGVTGVLVADKFSSKENNQDLTRFEAGDISLTIYENHPSRAILSNALSWSTEVGAFAKKSFVFDEYGRETQSTDSSGLQRRISYDDIFQTHRVKIVEEGRGVLHSEFTAYDLHSGQEVATLGTEGLLNCYKVDGFGRTVECCSGAAAEDQFVIKAADLFAQSPYVADKGLIEVLANANLCRQRKVSFERQTSRGGRAHMCTKVVTACKPGIEGEHEILEYVDCTKQVRKRSMHDGGEAEKIWVAWEYNSRGQPLFESFPVKVPASIDFDWVPSEICGIRSTFDILGRPLTSARPRHGDGAGFIVSTSDYLDGGSRVRDTVMSATNAVAPFNAAIKLASSERRTVRFGEEELVIEMVDENGLRKNFEYDAVGRLVVCIDAAGKVERREYSSQGDIISVDDPYRNPSQETGKPALRYKYNISRHLISEINVAGEEITYENDAKGRTLTKVGHDGRTVRCTYDQGGLQGLSSIEMTSRGSSTPESRLEFTYDHAGRVKSQKLQLLDGDAYETALAYDWQGQVVKKTLPGGVTLKNEYAGSQVVRSSLSGNSSFTWSLEAETKAYSAFGRPELLELHGSGLKSPLTQTWRYDAQGFPSAHTMETTGGALIDQRYVYNDMDQLSHSHDFLSGQTAQYVYLGRRLFQSQTPSGITSYAYDKSGNLTLNRGVDVAYTAGRAVGIRNGTPIFDIRYDSAGRMIQRQTQNSSLALNYDSFGSLASVIDSKAGSSVTILADHDGAMMQRKHSDGTSDLFLNDEVSVHTQSDGRRVFKYNLFNHNEADNKRHSLATISIAFESKESTRPLSGVTKLDIHFTNTKGNVTHVFDGKDASLAKKLEYDDYGLLDDDAMKDLGDNAHCTYEGTYLDELSGLLNFGGRWYDPLVCRFTTPDNVFDLATMLKSDGTNRFCFENNDPINNTDPTGHWTWSSILGVVVGALLIVAAVSVVIATGGAGGILVGALVGGLMAGGVAGIQYSIKNQDEQDAGRFWGGFAATVAINAAIGAAIGAAGAVAAPARMASAAARLAVRAVAGGAGNVLKQATDRGVENVFYGTHHDLFEGAVQSFLAGAAIAGALGAATDKMGGLKSTSGPNKLPGINNFEGSFKLRAFTGIRQVLEPKPTNPWAGLNMQIVKAGVKASLKPALNIGWGQVKDAYIK